MIRELVRRPRPAATVEIGWAGTDHAADLADLCRDQPAGFEMADPHGDVDVLVAEIDLPVLQMEFQRDFGVPFQEGEGDRQDVALAEQCRGRDAELAAGCIVLPSSDALGLFDLFEDASAGLDIG